MKSAYDSSQILLVPSRALLLLAALVWLLAGAGVLAAGTLAAGTAWNWGMGLGFLVVFGIFLGLFLSLSRRNVRRILHLDAPLSFIGHFFDVSSYIIMVVMIFLGLSVRISTFVPDWILAFFYAGLGAALLLSAFYPVIVYIQTWSSAHFD
ncbi:MAG: hypothetical protein FWC59_02775 [Actinomycetia bacterium]|nr:hypothetical protein [Actinomycetes bacterium]